MSKQTYTVLSRVDHDQAYAPGDAIELTKDEARPLLTDGVVCAPDDPRAARAGEGRRRFLRCPTAWRMRSPCCAMRRPPDQVQAFVDRMAGDDAIRAKVESAFSRAVRNHGRDRKASTAPTSPSGPRDGKPTTDALEAVLGFTVTADERDAAHAAIQES